MASSSPSRASSPTLLLPIRPPPCALRSTASRSAGRRRLQQVYQSTRCCPKRRRQHRRRIVRLQRPLRRHVRRGSRRNPVPRNAWRSERPIECAKSSLTLSTRIKLLGLVDYVFLYNTTYSHSHSDSFNFRTSWWKSTASRITGLAHWTLAVAIPQRPGPLPSSVSICQICRIH